MKNIGLVITKQNLETKNIFEQIYYKEIDYIRLTENKSYYILKINNECITIFKEKNIEVIDLFNKIVKFKNGYNDNIMGYPEIIELVLYYTEVNKIIELSEAEVNCTIYAHEYTKDYSNPDAKKI